MIMIDEWISVDESLPDTAENISVLVWHPRHLGDKDEWWECAIAVYLPSLNRFNIEGVTHWMPLPEAPASAR